MVIHPHAGVFHSDHLHNQALWEELYPWLYVCVRHFVYAFRISCWQGQEEDIIDDVVQETIRRTIERSQQAEQGELAPIYSLQHMMGAIAKNYICDLRRHDQRVVRLPVDQTIEASSPGHDGETHLKRQRKRCQMNRSLSG